MHFQSRENADLISLKAGVLFSGLVLPLDPHVLSISTRISLGAADQLFLFPALSVTL